jgi:RimJ/RimL family protein N-acetyltransferase
VAVPTDLELLAIQSELFLDERGRLGGGRGVTIRTAREGHLLLVGSEVPEALVPRLTEAAERLTAPSAPDQRPPLLDACREILERWSGPLTVAHGPYYVFEPDVRAETDAALVRSDSVDVERVRRLNPGHWPPQEWDELVAGEHGPWAMALVGGQVAAICHSPLRLSERAAECGVWTHPDHRGRGLAAAVTAAWADILHPSGRYLFYATDAQNYSSQRVAARLGLRPIGWTWNLARTDSEPAEEIHPFRRRSPCAHLKECPHVHGSIR